MIIIDPVMKTVDVMITCSICVDMFTYPVSTPCGHTYCKACITRYWAVSEEYRCPLCANVFHDWPELSVDRSLTEMVRRFKSRKAREEYESKTGDELRRMIREREEKIQQVECSAMLSRKNLDVALEGSAQVYNNLIKIITSDRAKLERKVEEKRKTAAKQTEGFIEDLHREIAQLEKRISGDHLRVPQNYVSGEEPLPPKDWTKIDVRPVSLARTVRRFVSYMKEGIHFQMGKDLGDAELRRVEPYEVDVTLDPDTAHPELILSEDGKHVSCGDIWRNLPDEPQRFSTLRCILGKQGFASGRFFFEVYVRRSTHWEVGVTSEG